MDFSDNSGFTLVLFCCDLCLEFNPDYMYISFATHTTRIRDKYFATQATRTSDKSLVPASAY